MVNSSAGRGCKERGARCHKAAYNTALRPASLLVENRIEVGIVVHLELTVEAEAALAGQDLRPELVEALRKVRALLRKDDQAIFITVMVFVGSGRTMYLFVGMVDLQRENGEAIDDESGSFGVERGFRILRSGELKEQLIDLFDEVISLLVEPVDGMFHLSDAGIGDVRAASRILFVPEVEVGKVLRADEGNEVGRGCFGGMVAVPEEIGLVVESEDGVSVKLRGGGWSGLGLSCWHGD